MKMTLKQYKNNDGEFYQIVERGNPYSKIRFNGYKEIITRHNDFIEKGAVKNPFKPVVYGVGYFGFTSEKLTPKRTTEYRYIYEAWKSMLRRCYEKSNKHQRYKLNGSNVDPEWHSFRNFYIWTKSNISNFKVGYELDKDLIGNGIEYSKYNCVYLPKALNHMIQSQSYKTNLPEGVKMLPSGRFQVNVSVLKNKINLGTYDDLPYAKNVYKVAKDLLLFKRAEFHYNKEEIPLWIYDYILKKGWIDKTFDCFDPYSIYISVEEVNYDRAEMIKNNTRLKYFYNLLTEGNFRDYPNRKSEETSDGELVGVQHE